MSGRRYPQRIAYEALGIRAQDLRTLVRRSWWARRWIAAIESLHLGARFGRGRQYAMAGQVTDLRFSGPHVTATVLGSRPQPYTVTLDFTTPPDDALERLAATLRARPVLLARLLTDDLPLEVETLFAEAGCPLFPVAGVRPPYDVRMACTCPDWARPCKHLAAVLFLLGEEVTRRPLTLLTLRGIDPDEIFPPSAAVSEEPDFSLADTASVTTDGGDPLALVKRLGPVPLWHGVNRCTESLARMLTRQHPVAVAAARGESVDLRA